MPCCFTTLSLSFLLFVMSLSSCRYGQVAFACWEESPCLWTSLLTPGPHRYLPFPLYTLVSHVSFYDDHSIGLNRLPVCFLLIDFCLFDAKIVSDWSPCPQDVAHNNSSVEWHRTSYQVGRASWVGTANEGTETLLTVPHLGPIFDSS